MKVYQLGKGYLKFTYGFANERGYGRDTDIEDLKIMGSHMRNKKDEQFFKERMRREVETRISK